MGVKEMDKNEKTLLLQLLMYDVRLDWSLGLRDRMVKIKRLAVELGFDAVVENTDSMFDQLGDRDFVDGRQYRVDIEDGGYEGLERYHGFDKLYVRDKSEEFQELVEDFIKNPELIFLDVEEE